MCVAAVAAAIALATLPQRALSAVVRRAVFGRAAGRASAIAVWLWCEACVRVLWAAALLWAVLGLVGDAPLVATLVVGARVTAVAAVWPNAFAAAALAVGARVRELREGRVRGVVGPATAAAAALGAAAQAALVSIAAACGAPCIVRRGTVRGPAGGEQYNEEHAVACAAGVSPAAGVVAPGGTAAPAWPYVHGGYFAAAPFMLR